jgi:uncharacterized protein (DUF302 family)
LLPKVAATADGAAQRAATARKEGNTNWNDTGTGMGLGWLRGLLILVLVILATEAPINYLRRWEKDFAMTYTINRVISGTGIDDIDTRARKALADQGFGVLTEIDVKATMKKKLDVEMPAYRILGACNPKMAYQAIGIEPRVGAMLPCNVILREVEDGVEVSAIDPVASMQAIENAELTAVANDVRDLLTKAVAAI